MHRSPFAPCAARKLMRSRFLQRVFSSRVTVITSPILRIQVANPILLQNLLRRAASEKILTDRAVSLGTTRHYCLGIERHYRHTGSEPVTVALTLAERVLRDASPAESTPPEHASMEPTNATTPTLRAAPIRMRCIKLTSAAAQGAIGERVHFGGTFLQAREKRSPGVDL